VEPAVELVDVAALLEFLSPPPVKIIAIAARNRKDFFVLLI
jgi:hypothetical protein